MSAGKEMVKRDCEEEGRRERWQRKRSRKRNNASFVPLSLTYTSTVIMNGIQFQMVPFDIGDTYRFDDISVRGPPATGCTL